MSTSGRLDLVVTDSAALTPSIRAIRLAHANGGVLPGWEPGAHIKIDLPDGGERSYSLINPVADLAAMTAPASYLLGVRLEEAGQGGSRHMHDLRPGDIVSISLPTNHFPLEPSDGPVALVAGGIGVTPILSMAAALQAERCAYRFIYAGRSRDQLAFLPEIEALVGDALTLHTDDKSGVLDIVGVMASLHNGEPLYVCGPTPMIEAAIATAKALGWPQGRLRFEIFAAAAPVAGDQAFEIVLKTSGKRYQIPADKSILDVLIEAGEDPLHDCKRGDCGICQVGVIEGAPDHRDFILSDSEKAAGKLMQICVSRSKTPSLVLDL